MRNILLLCAAVLAIGAYLLWNSTRQPTVAGAFSGAPKVEVSQLIENPKAFLNKTIAVEGQIREQCKTMGCFFFFHSGDKQLRVDLESIAMTAPMREGRPARVEGQLVPFGDGYQLFASAIEFK